MLRRLNRSLESLALLSAAPVRPTNAAHLPLAPSSCAAAMNRACAWTKKRRVAMLSALMPWISSLASTLHASHTRCVKGKAYRSAEIIQQPDKLSNVA